jgi:integrase
MGSRSIGQASGHVRLVKRARGPVFYAAIRLADGRRLQRRIGRAWLSRSRPPTGYVTRPQAEVRLRDILVGADPSISIAGSGVTFGVAAENWLAYIRDDRKRRPSTVSGYRRELDRNLLPEFGPDTPLDEITTQGIDAYRERLVAEGKLSARTINKRLAQLHAIFKRAQRTYDLAKNPVEGAERQPHRLSGDITVLDARQVELLASKAANEQDGAIFRVAAFTGLRLGELRALRWGDVDWVRQIIRVRRSYTWGAEGAPKSGKVRSVPLSDQPARALERLSRRDLWTGDDDLVFVSQTGGFVDESALRRRFYKALKAAKLPRMRFHDLRHTFGTLAVQAFSLTDVKAFMGHADIQTTMIYAHHVPQHDAADKLTRLLGAHPARRTVDARFENDEDPNEAESPSLQEEDECRRRDSNPRHADYDRRHAGVGGLGWVLTDTNG